MNESTPTKTLLIEAAEISRSDAKTQRVLLQNSSLSIHSSDRIGLIGPSGSGKSTLLRALAILDRCNSGEIRFQGQLIQDDAVPRFRRQVVYLPQRASFVASTVRENLRIPFQLSSSQTEFDEAKAISLLSQFGRSPDLLEQQVSELSGGEQQIVALVRTISLDPLVILFDEPTASLDAASADQFEQMVNQWHSEDQARALIWTSHDHTQVDRMSSRVIEIQEGRIISASPEALS